MSEEDRVGPVRVGDLVDTVLDRRGVRRQMLRTRILDEWEDIVGEGIAQRTEPVKVSGDTLIVEVESSPWLMELNMMKHDIMRRLNAGREDGRIEKLIFVLAGR